LSSPASVLTATILNLDVWFRGSALERVGWLTDANTHTTAAAAGLCAPPSRSEFGWSDLEFYITQYHLGGISIS
jgi:hypothetical protein